MWWHGNDRPGREGKQEGAGSGGEITARGGRQARKRQIILLCTVCRLNLHSSYSRHIEKGKKKKLWNDKYTAHLWRMHTPVHAIKYPTVQMYTTELLLPYGSHSQFRGSSRIMNLNTSKEEGRFKKKKEKKMDQLFILSYQLNLNVPVALTDKPGVLVLLPSVEPPKQAQIL